MALNLILCSILISALSGLPGLFLPRGKSGGQVLAAVAMVLAMAIGLIGAGWGIVDPNAVAGFLPWPAMGGTWIGLDALSAWFLVPILLVGGLGPVFGLGYWPQRHHHSNGRKLSLFWGLLVAGMCLLVIGRQAFAFLLGWETMALSAFFLVATEDRKAESRRAGYVYLIATHVGTLCLFGWFTLWHWLTGSYDLAPLAAGQAGMGELSALFLLALVGFGLKAGIMPFHFWLPGAHANAPTHVSAILSGVVLKMGIYGLLRVLWLMPQPPMAWGGLILVLGGVSTLFGVLFALAQHDLKRLLAYHSVENIGIILIGLGLAMIGRSSHNDALLVLGLAGCLLHVWNHSLFKTLLFFGAGSVIHASHSRQMDQLGGLARGMPITAALFLVGAVAICGLPPLNGFVSELLVYLGLFHNVAGGTNDGLATALAAPILAAVGALAVACFVKVFGTVFLGQARTPAAATSRESPASMTMPMLVLALCCLCIGIAPVLAGPLLDGVIKLWSGNPALAPVAVLSPLLPIGIVAALVLALVLALVILANLRRRRDRSALTWDCGYARPTSRMQYTASSIASSLVGLFGWVLRPQEHRAGVKGAFPAPARWSSHVNEVVLDRLLQPVSGMLRRWSLWLRRFQQGLTQHYVAYILIALILLLLPLIPFQSILSQLLAR